MGSSLEAPSLDCMVAHVFEQSLPLLWFDVLNLNPSGDTNSTIDDTCF